MGEPPLPQLERRLRHLLRRGVVHGAGAGAAMGQPDALPSLPRL